MQSDIEKRLRSALRWCSGTDDFQVGGKAREGWEKVCVPLLTTETQKANKKRHCCMIGCDKEAEYAIYFRSDGEPSDSTNTDACTKHVGELLTDALMHWIYPIAV